MPKRPTDKAWLDLAALLGLSLIAARRQPVPTPQHARPAHRKPRWLALIGTLAIFTAMAIGAVLTTDHHSNSVQISGTTPEAYVTNGVHAVVAQDARDLRHPEEADPTIRRYNIGLICADAEGLRIDQLAGDVQAFIGMNCTASNGVIWNPGLHTRQLVDVGYAPTPTTAPRRTLP